MGRLEDAGTDIKDYEKVRHYAENRHVKNASRAAGKSIPKDTDKMVYGVEAAPLQPPPTTCAGGCGGCALHPAPPGLDTTPGTYAEAAAYDPWAGAQDPWSCPPCAPEAQEGMWQLDAFGKGKGKDKGKNGKGKGGWAKGVDDEELAEGEEEDDAQQEDEGMSVIFLRFSLFSR